MKEKLRTQIQKLHDLIEETDIDQASGESLKKVSGDVNAALVSGKSDVNRSFGAELEQEALKFEEKHPAITQVIREIVRTLHNVGI